MNHLQLEQLLNDTLSSSLIKDYCPNGMQVEGRTEVSKIITGVTASQALIDYAIAQHADAILVHHGYFWKGEAEAIKGMKGKRIRHLIKHDINLYAYHLPLDVHPTLGNNAQLADLLGIKRLGHLEVKPNGVVMVGEFEQAITAQDLAQKITQVLNRAPLHISGQVSDHANRSIKSIAWCTGGGQDYIELAAEQGCDAFISGEISERTTHSARELGIDYFAAGHHATERYGIKALGEWLAREQGLSVEFVDMDNPV